MARPEAVPKCPRCKGWAFEPDTYPFRNCGACGGTGRQTARQQELANG